MLAIPAFATVTDSSGDGFALYGGVKLPDIDSIWSSYVASYPNAIIFTGVVEGSVYYSLGLSAVELDYNGSYLGTDGQYAVVTAILVYDSSVAELFGIPVGEWSSMGESVNNGYAVQGNAVWSSYDIINITDNSVYFPASDPVSLDGYNVIEWDGDITGLEKDGSSYRVYDSIDPTSTVSVRINADNSLTVGTFLEHFSEVGMWTCGLNVEEFPFAFGGDDIGTFFMKETGTPNNPYCSLLAYRTVESPPDEGGGDDDEPQPPFRVADI